MQFTRSHAGIALVSMASLIFEVSLTRILSFTLWYHFAFLVVAVALLGSAAAGSWLSLRKPGTRIHVQRWALALAVALPLAHALFQSIPFEPFELSSEPVQWIWAALGLSLLAAPFFASGLSVASLLQNADEKPFGIYAADMIGAALGAAITPLLMSLLGAPALIIVASLSAALAALLFAWQAHDKLIKTLSALFVVVSMIALPFAQDILPWRVSNGKKIAGQAAEKILRDKKIDIYSAWDMASRVDVLATRQGARILIDGGTAMTRVPHVPTDLNAMQAIVDVNSAVLAPARGHKALIIGSGGGWEVLRALSYQASEIDAVEINGKVVDWIRQDMRFGASRLFSDPRVNLVHDEARAYLAGQNKHYRAILMIHTISNAAMGAGAMSLAENYILTREAFGELIEHLDDDGLLLITRPDAQLVRLRNTIAAALPPECQDIDSCSLAFVDPRAGGFFAGLVVSKTPMTPTHKQEIRRLWQNLGLSVFAPSEIKNPETRALLIASDDDKPYFSQRVAFGDLRLEDLRASFANKTDSQQQADQRMSLERRPIAELAVLSTSLIAIVLGLLGIFVPLLLNRRQRRALSQSPGRTMLRFALLGLGFMFVEMGLMQQLTRVLGQPSLAFAVVLASILVGAGLSSQLIAPQLLKHRRAVLIAFSQAAVISAVFSMILPLALGLLSGAPIMARVVISALFGLILGTSLGLPFPISLSLLAKQSGSISWAFAVNGFASVAAPALAVIVSAQWGLQWSMLIAALLYLLGGLIPEANNSEAADKNTSAKKVLNTT